LIRQPNNVGVGLDGFYGAQHTANGRVHGRAGIRCASKGRELVARSRRDPTSRTFAMSYMDGLAREPTVTPCNAMSEAYAWGISIDAFCVSTVGGQRGKGSTNHREVFLQADMGDDYRRPPLLSCRFCVFLNLCRSVYMHALKELRGRMVQVKSPMRVKRQKILSMFPYIFVIASAIVPLPVWTTPRKCDVHLCVPRRIAAPFKSNAMDCSRCAR
jgi:hypothetical protein